MFALILPSNLGGLEIKMLGANCSMTRSCNSTCNSSKRKEWDLKQDWQASPQQFLQPKAKFESFPEMSGCKARHMRYLALCLLEICRDQVDEKKL